eukprot:2057977-Rhodomonas_salina.1
MVMFIIAHYGTRVPGYQGTSTSFVLHLALPAGVQGTGYYYKFGHSKGDHCAINNMWYRIS